MRQNKLHGIGSQTPVMKILDCSHSRGGALLLGTRQRKNKRKKSAKCAVNLSGAGHTRMGNCDVIHVIENIAGIGGQGNHEFRD